MTHRALVWLAFACCAALGAFGASPDADLVVHEWGTITTVHAADGTAQGALNKIDASEVLPKFVHRYEPESTRADPKLSILKSPWVPGRPEVRMRLETPVIYFHPATARHYERPIDVEILFRGGVINEFYPAAEPEVFFDVARAYDKTTAGVIGRPWTGEVFNNYVLGRLTWRNVRLLDTVTAPLTSDPVWTAPREVQATSVFLPDAGEGERYLFYRGVAALDALLQTRTARSHVRLLAPAHLVWLQAESLTLPRVWLAEVRAEGTAFRAHGALTLRKSSPGKELARLKRFAGPDFSAQQAGSLRASLKTALIEQGLFADEAEAMLETWKHSYFEKPGLRLFYVVPREWTNHFLPLRVSVPVRVERVLIGRIDLLPAGQAPAGAAPAASPPEVPGS
jgi:hypothetical protein